LRPILGRDLAYSLKLHDNLAETDEIGRIARPELSSAVLKPQGLLSGEGDPAKLEFDLEALL
jgi:hypothetical protein